MALYRNIAGVNPGQLGVTITSIKDLFSPTADVAPPTGGGLIVSQPNTIQILPPGTQWGSGMTPQDSLQQIHAAIDALEAARLSYYTYLLSTSPDDLAQAGYYVSTDTGAVMQWVDNSRGISNVYLPLDSIQDIENKAGTAGALFMHMGLPVIAKDTAGYAGGGRASQGATTMYSTPIADVLAIPATPTGENVINDYNPPVRTPPNITPGYSDETPAPGSGVPTTTTTPTSTIVSGNTLGVVALGLAAIAVARSKKLLLMGGLGLLYYSMSKTKTV